MSYGLLSGISSMKVEGGYTLHLLSALEILQARREGLSMAQNGLEQALCTNACLLSRALTRGGAPLYEDGEAVLSHMTPQEIERLSQIWYQFSRQENPSPEDSQEPVNQIKKGWSIPLMSAFVGVCSAPFKRSLQRLVPKK